MARHITPPHPQSRGSDFELAYASPTVTKEQGADTESIRRYNRKCRGPLCLNDEAGTLYPDGRNRRLRGASDDAANPTADGYFVEHLRVGGPYLCPMPVYTSTTNIQPLDIPLPPSGSTGESFEDRVMKIIDKHRIQTPPIDLFPAEKDGGFGRMDPTSVWLAQRGSGRYDEPEHLVDTLAILATRASLEDPWLDCVRDLREMLCHENLAHVCVEVVDGQAYGIRNANQRLYTFPVFASDEIFAKWESVLGVILETVDLTDIRSISCYRRGRRKDVDVNPPTVLIIADTESNRCWKSTRENVVQILNNFDLYMVAVEISKDFVLESSDWTMNKGIPPALLEAGNTKIGDSIALHQNTQSSGTLGGFVELQNPETHQWHPYALTCFRCVDPANLGGDISPSKFFNTNGYSGTDHSIQRSSNGVGRVYLTPPKPIGSFSAWTIQVSLPKKKSSRSTRVGLRKSRITLGTGVNIWDMSLSRRDTDSGTSIPWGTSHTLRAWTGH